MLMTPSDNTNDRMRFKVGSAESLVVKGDGNVGIGTSSPNAAIRIICQSLNGENALRITNKGAQSGTKAATFILEVRTVLYGSIKFVQVVYKVLLLVVVRARALEFKTADGR